MKRIRKNLFETNSSSTHCVVVSKENHASTEYMSLYSFGGWCFGRCESQIVDCLADKIAYAYIVADDLSRWKEIGMPDLKEKFLKNLYDVAEKYYIKDPSEHDIYDGFLKENLDKLIETIDKASKDYNAYVDHVEDFVDNGFAERLANDPEFVERLIFDDDSYITCGGDEYRGYNIKTIGFEHDYDDSYNPEFERKYDEENWPVYADPSEMYIGEFWDKVKKYREDFDVYFKGN